jgi:hypothetical protein
MAFLFWSLWIFNLLLLLLALFGKGFRAEFGAGVDLNNVIIAGLILILAASALLRFGGKQKWVSLVVGALPALTMILWYVFDKITGKPNGPI